MKNFRDLQIWNRSHGLTLDFYRITQSFPSTETYGLLSQMRRSASELEYQLILACDLRYIAQDIFETTNAELIEIKRMLNAFIQ